MNFSHFYNSSAGSSSLQAEVNIYDKPARKKPKRVYNRLIQTPHGHFTSFVKASEALIVDRRTIKSYCLNPKKLGWSILLGEEARAILHRVINKATSRYVRNSNPKKIRKKAVHTPFGVFKTARACAKKLGMSYDTLLYRLVRCKEGRFPDWYYQEMSIWELQDD